MNNNLPTDISTTHQHQLKPYTKKLSILSKEINQLRQELNIKYQELDDFKKSIAKQDEIRSHLNGRCKKLQELNLNIPNFLIIGTQKGGTTWLHENLKKHPQIFLPEGRKELEFFSYYQKKINDLGLSSYLKSFNQFDDTIQIDRPVAIGEATPSYFWSANPSREWTNPPQFFNKNIPNSVFNVLGSKVKLILCLRDPVERAISAYFHHIRRNRFSYETKSILEIGHLYGIIDMGFYSQHLKVWLEKFKLDNFKILIYEQHIKKNKEKTIEDICDFLDVNYQLYPASTNLNTYHNRGLQYRIDETGVFLLSPDEKIESMVVSLDEIKQLREIYYDDYLSLQKIIDLDLSKSWGFV
jgi:hypothetical protein